MELVDDLHDFAAARAAWGAKEKEYEEKIRILSLQYEGAKNDLKLQWKFSSELQEEHHKELDKLTTTGGRDKRLERLWRSECRSNKDLRNAMEDTLEALVHIDKNQTVRHLENVIDNLEMALSAY